MVKKPFDSSSNSGLRLNSGGDCRSLAQAGLIEKYGSGIKRILEGFSQYGLSQPRFEELQHGFKVTIYKTTQKTTQKMSTRAMILGELRRNPKITRSELSEILNKSPNTIKEHIARLKTEGIIKRVGSDRNGYWELLDRGQR